jgi:hypothetical protein
VYHQQIRHTHWRNWSTMCRHTPAYTGIMCQSQTGISHLLSFNLNYIFKFSWNQCYYIWLVYFYNLYTIIIRKMLVRNRHTMCRNSPAYTGIVCRSLSFKLNYIFKFGWYMIYYIQLLLAQCWSETGTLCAEIHRHTPALCASHKPASAIHFLLA